MRARNHYIRTYEKFCKVNPIINKSKKTKPEKIPGILIADKGQCLPKIAHKQENNLRRKMTKEMKR